MDTSILKNGGKDFERFDSSVCDTDIPESAYGRTITDKYPLIVLIVVVLLLMPFLIYTLNYSDIKRLRGYDSCGNICGENNAQHIEWDCAGKNMTNKPLYISGVCEERNYFSSNLTLLTQEDRNNKTIANVEDACRYILRAGQKITLSSFISLGYCLIMVILFRYATSVQVWATLVLSWLCLLMLLVYLWSCVIESISIGAVFGIIGLTSLSIVLLIIMISIRKQMILVIMFIKETTKPIFDMPLIFFIPTMKIFGMLIITAVATVLSIYMYTSGRLTELSDGKLDYVPNIWMMITWVYNFIVVYWAIHFIAGIQCMVISGAISKWYFAKNKALLGSPILTSALIAFRFHLGTAALGSLIIKLMSILRLIFRIFFGKILKQEKKPNTLHYIDAYLGIFTKKSYIVTAIHGSSFYQSGKQAVKLIALNISFCKMVVVNIQATFVLGLAQLLVIALSVLTTYVLFLGEPHSDYTLYCYIIVACIALILSSSILGGFRTALDTIFLCFCEDCLINDGKNKPYAFEMSPSFTEFVVSVTKTPFQQKLQSQRIIID